MIKTYRYRLLTNKTQERLLSDTLETHRRLYNECLSGKQMCWEAAGVNWTWQDQSRWFKSQRIENRHFAKLNFGSSQQTIRKLDKAFSSFFRRCKLGGNPGYPRFKSRDRFDSFYFAMTGNGGGCKVVLGKLRLQNIGSIRVLWHREIPPGSKVLYATIKRKANKWYACFSVESDSIVTASHPGEKTGIDVGLKCFVTTSSGDILGESKILYKNQKEMRVRQRALARCRKGSNRRKKVKMLATKLHEKVANTRRDMHHKVAHNLVSRYGFIAAESLSVEKMLKNRRLSRSIADAGWSSFIDILKHKAECAGVKVVLVDPAFTSQECSQCGKIVPKKLSERVHSCECGCVLDRDVNAAKNILARGLAWTGPGELNVDHKIKRVRGSRCLKATE